MSSDIFIDTDSPIGQDLLVGIGMGMPRVSCIFDVALHCVI